jgi:hypothetical protein
MSSQPLADFVTGFLKKQAEREQQAQCDRERECATILVGYQHLMTDALGADALAALKPEWDVEIVSTTHFRAKVALQYKGETFNLKDAPGQRVEKVGRTVASLILEVDEEQEELAAERAKLSELLSTRPLPDHVTSAWWNRIQRIVGDDADLLELWDKAMVIFDERVQEAQVQGRLQRKKDDKASRTLMLKTVADIEKSNCDAYISRMRNDIPRTINHEDRRTIQEAAFERLQELDLEFERQQEDRKERILKIERAVFWAFHFYEVHYQTGVFHEEAHSGVETAILNCYSAECTQDGWWFTADGRRVRLPFVSKVVECVVCAPDGFWPTGMWKMGETDDGLKYRVPSPLAVLADADACAQAKEV